MPWLETAVVLAVALPVLGLLERLEPEMPAGRRRCERRTDLGYLLLCVAYLPALGGGLGWLLVHLGGAGAASLREQCAAFLVADVAGYAVHRAQHRLPLLWRSHAIHHADRQVNRWTGLRFHPLDVLPQQAGPVVAVAVLRVPSAAVAPYLIAVTLVTLYAHVDVDLRCGWLARVVVTPGYHRTHHERAGEGANFARVLPVVDALFGTSRVATGARSFGTAPEVPVAGMWRQMRFGFGQRSTSSPAHSDSALAV